MNNKAIIQKNVKGENIKSEEEIVSCSIFCEISNVKFTNTIVFN